MAPCPLAWAQQTYVTGGLRWGETVQSCARAVLSPPSVATHLEAMAQKRLRAGRQRALRRARFGWRRAGSSPSDWVASCRHLLTPRGQGAQKRQRHPRQLIAYLSQILDDALQADRQPPLLDAAACDKTEIARAACRSGRPLFELPRSRWEHAAITLPRCTYIRPDTSS